MVSIGEHAGASWLFTRGGESVRVERIDVMCHGLRLIVNGPGREHHEHEFADENACTSHQTSFERHLTALGFHLEDFSDRRHDTDRRHAPRGRDRRR